MLHVSDMDPASSQSLADLRALLLLFADEVAKLARGTRGQGGAPIISRLGDGLERDQDPRFLSPSSGLTSCSFVWADPDTIWHLPNGQTTGFPKSNWKKSRQGEMAKVLTYELSREIVATGVGLDVNLSFPLL